MDSMDSQLVAEFISSIGAPLCECGEEAPLRTSWTEDNPGRRFYSCPNYGEGKCNFFVWVDPKFIDRSKNVINSLLRKANRLEKENRELKMEDTVKYGKWVAWGVGFISLGIPVCLAMMSKKK